MKKKKLLFISVISFLFTFIFGLLSLPIYKTEKVFAAENSTKRVTQEGFFIEEGASVRVNGSSYNENGLRYTVGMEKEAYEMVMAENSGFTDITFGVLIAPASAKYNLTPESVFGVNDGTVQYDWAVEDENGNLVYNGDGTKSRIINLQTDTLFNVKDRSGDDYYFHGSIINVNKDNLTREFQGKGYVLYTENGVKKCIMLSNETHIRSIVYVSQMAVEANSAHSAWLKENYITVVSDMAAKYTEENYLEQADGSFKLDESTKKTIAATINKSVSLGTAPTFSGYVYDQADERNVVSGNVYVNDKLTLKRYYRLGYPTSELQVETASTVTTFFSVSANQDATQAMINNLGENYVAVTVGSTSIASAGFYGLAINLAGTASDSWTGDLSLQFTPNGWYLTSGNINADVNRIARFNTALELKASLNTSTVFTLIYKATYNGNDYYTNGMSLEFWIAKHSTSANIKTISFTKLVVDQILNSEKAKMEGDKLTINYTALPQEKFIPDFNFMTQAGWNTSCSWEVKNVQILTSAPSKVTTSSSVVPAPRYEYEKPLNNNLASIKLIKPKYETEGALVVDAIATDYGADPTGTTDSTAAIQSALSYVGGLGGGTVFLPVGKYLVSSTISIPNFVSLVGDWNKPDADNTDEAFDYGTVILARPQTLTSGKPQDNPLFFLGDASGVVGLTFYYVDQDATAVKDYGYTIYGNAPATATLRNLTFLNCTYGIGVSLNQYSNELINLENIYGTFLYNAIHHNATTDVGFYNNINISSKYWKNASKDYQCDDMAALDSFINHNLTAMILGDLDDQMISNVTIDGGKIGIKFTTGIRDSAGFWGLVYNANITCEKGVYADYLNSVSGVVFTDSNVGIVENNSPVGCVKMSNSNYQKAGSGRVVQEGGKVTIDNGNVDSLSLEFPHSQRLFIADSLTSGGMTDNSEKLQTILNSVGAEGGIVVVPNGVYRLNSSVVVPENVELRSTQAIFTRSRHEQAETNGVLFISYVSGATFVLKDNAGVVGARIWHAKNDFITARDALNNGSYSNDISIKGEGSGAYAYMTESVGAYVGYDFSACDNHVLKSNYGLSYVNFIKAGGNNGVITQCLANPNFMTRSNIYLYIDGSAANVDNWARIKNSGESNADFAILRDEIGKTHTKMVRLENAKNQVAFNVFCYGHAGLFDMVNSTATLVNTSIDYVFNNNFVYELSGGSCGIIGSLRVFGTSLKVNSGVLKAYGRIAFGEVKEKAYDSSVSLEDVPEYVSENAKRRTLFNCDKTSSQFNISLNTNSNYVKEGSGSWRWKTTTLEGKFTSIDISEYRNGYLHFYLYCSDISKIGTEGQIEITSSGTCDVNEYNWYLTQYVTKTGWNDVWLDLSGAGTTGGVADLTSINYLRIYTLNSSATFYIDGIEVVTD